LKSNRTLRFIHSSDVPQRFLSDSDRNTHHVSPGYLAWEEQDQAVFSWLLNSISEALHPRVVGCVHSWQLWSELHAFCNSHTKARSRQLRTQLRSLSQGSMTISEFFSKVKSLTDSLISIGTPISLEENVDCILDGLNEDFQNVITSVESQVNSPSIHELEQFLLTFESRLAKNKNQSVSDALSANMVAQSPPQSPLSVSMPSPTVHSHSPHYSGILPRPPGNFQSGFYTQTRGGRSGKRGGRGFRSGRNFTRPGSFFCDYCRKPGHDISWCYYAPYDSHHGTLTPSHFYGQYQHQNQYGAPTSNMYSRPSTPHGSYSPGTMTRPYSPVVHQGFGQGYPNVQSGNFYRGHSPLPPYAYHHPGPSYAMNAETSSQDSRSSLWYPDSGATNHLTSDSSLLHEPTEHFGPDQIYMGNGAKAPITSSGNTYFHSTNFTTSLSLQNLLLVPTITKNLMSVSQFAKDNSCYFEFHPNYCVVKSQGSDEVLLQGTLTSEGLYAFSNLIPKSASKKSHISPTTSQ
ncbi:PREDICTED: uncharacterized protein LOC109337698, partial [Lupinus angustifolius]|uniref:uncharacterized protein LOC109337698 n=1 Tax=Lupinus angustifolius TaxID=3871 RepID=UPI00092F7F22